MRVRRTHEFPEPKGDVASSFNPGQVVRSTENCAYTYMIIENDMGDNGYVCLESGRAHWEEEEKPWFVGIHAELHTGEDREGKSYDPR